MPKLQDLKCWPEYFEETWNGNRYFEVRKNDRDYQLGDLLLIREWCPNLGDYTGRHIERTASYILKDEYFVKKGFVVIGLINLVAYDLSDENWNRKDVH